ncbi:MAG: 5-bromo-4-chloroindolyl phosphate hydrolysis family protein [Clostridia bacterium]|nr:5-bromo-4-chloroindolyl phosphate hydrolysis family protein [Clostridia bacterium]
MSNDRDPGASWLTIAIFLAIPFLRFFGIFMLIKKVSRMINLSKKQTDLIYVLAVILLFTSAGEIFSWIKSSLFISVLPVSAIAVALVLFTKYMNASQDKLDSYVSSIGLRDEAPLDEIMSEMGVTERKLRRDISALKKSGRISKSAYIDEGRRMLVLNPEIVRARQATKRKEDEEQAKYQEETEYKHILLEIRALNVMIDDENVSKKIDRIEQITRAIFDIVSNKPERRREIDTFMDYYLPTTVKLLKNYAHLEQQTVLGENIVSSRARIEGILDKLVEGFEKQLDILFKSDAVDITSDIKTLEKMLQMDGLNR